VSALAGYPVEVASHLEVARAVQAGRADVGMGLSSSARQLGLDFIPLFDEPYDLVGSPEVFADARYAPFFELVQSGEFRQAIDKLGGYHASQDAGRFDLIA
jgi:putative molybdopterin biosynthesis protein